MTLYYEPQHDRADTLAAALPGNPRAAADLAGLAALVRADPTEQLVVVGPSVGLADAAAFASAHRLCRPTLGVVLLRDQVNVAVLGEAIRCGVREVVVSGDSQAARAACVRSLEVSRQLLTDRDPAADSRPAEGQLVTVFAGKGGCGKSTMATNLAIALARGERASVCLVDLDLSFGDIAIMLQLVPKRSLADAVPMAGRLDETAIRSLVTPYAAGIDTLLAPPGPAEGDRVGRELVSEILKIAKRMYDYVVVDTPPFFSDQVLAALDLSRWYILLATPDIPSLKNLRLTLDMFDLIEYPSSQRIVVLNRADSHVGLTESDIDRVVRAPIGGRLPSTRDVPVSINRGVPLSADNPSHPFSRSIQEIAESWLMVRETSGGAGTASRHSAHARAGRRSFALLRRR